MPVGTVRIYDLARELKQDTKRVIEELRREGADVNVPSNSVTKEIAEKVRGRYFPKTEVAPKRTIKVIKKAPKTEEAAEQEIAEVEAVAAQEVEIEKPKKTVKPPVIEESKPEKSTRRVRKLQKKVEAEPSEKIPVVEEIPQIAQVENEAKETETPEEVGAIAEDIKVNEQTAEAEEVKPVTSRVLRPTGSQVKQLKLTQEARERGFKTGDRIVSEAPTQTGRLKTESVNENVRKDSSRDGKSAFHR
ncbi:MAG: translation initiation factor IF-2 N-terminal domain-containing protein [Acidobacteria bacterium]|nr:translation initiation factor IF-2 N-terminal domain-containing protein [Acidobacteriota bacterium]